MASNERTSIDEGEIKGIDRAGVTAWFERHVEGATPPLDFDLIAGGRLIGRTEADVAREVRDRLVEEGHDEPSFSIVASGPNSASPHHDASDRLIAPGEPIVLDIGGTLGGYRSDITRTLWITGADGAKGPDARFVELFGVLAEAQATGTRAVRPGIACEAID